MAFKKVGRQFFIGPLDYPRDSGLSRRAYFRSSVLPRLMAACPQLVWRNALEKDDACDPYLALGYNSDEHRGIMSWGGLHERAIVMTPEEFIGHLLPNSEPPVVPPDWDPDSVPLWDRWVEPEPEEEEEDDE